MRVLWLKAGGLWPPTSGGRLRSIHLLSELAARHAVTLLTTHGAADDPGGLARAVRGARLVSLPHEVPKQGSRLFGLALVASWPSRLPVDLWRWRVRALRERAFELLEEERPDLVVADFLAAVPNLPPRADVPTVLFEHNVEHLLWKRLAEVEPGRLRAALLQVEWRKMRAYEARAVSSARLTLAVSEADARVLRDLSPGARIEAIATGVDTAYFAPNGWGEDQKSLVFLGSMDWFPNEEGVLHFIREVLPRVRSEVPEATLTVVGRNPRPRLLSEAAAAGVRVTGTVDDVRPEVGRGAVVVVPLRVGGGTRLKIFEALAMGKAVVSTTVGAEGLPLLDGKHFVRADGPGDFAAAVVALLKDPARRRGLGAAGRRLVGEEYSWARVARDFESKCNEVIHAG